MSKELSSEKDILFCLRKQGFYAKKTVDKYASGKADWRLGRSDLGQLDVEYKYCTVTAKGIMRPVKTGITKLQFLKMIDRNSHGMPSIGLIYVKVRNVYVISNLVTDDLTNKDYNVIKGNKPHHIDGAELFKQAERYLKWARTAITVNHIKK